MDNFDLKKYLAEGRIHEAQEIDMAKSFLENKGLKVEAISSGNDGEAKASKFAGVSNPEADKTAYIWDGGEGESNNKSNGKEAFYVYMPFNEDILKEMEAKFPVLDVGGKSGTYYTLTIEKANLKEGTSSTPTGRIQIDSNFDSVKELMEEVLQIVQDAGPSLTYDAITVERKIQELIEMMTPDQRAQDQSARRAMGEGKLLKENQYKSFVDEMYQAVGGIDAVLGANKPPNIPRDVWGELYGMAGDMTDKADQLLYLDEGEGDEVRDGVKTAAEKLGMKPNHIK
tara:strand:- start:134 stop:988 length:855 start_codon:yes stop_codon:yes gene_type:complete